MQSSTFWMAPAILLFSIILSGCGSGFTSSSSQSPATSEPASYETPSAVTDGLTFSVDASFEHRPLVYVSNQPTKLSASTAVRDFIHHAEFHIYNSAGTRIQQGTTGTGSFQFVIPKTLGTYTLKVFSRAFNDYMKVSVLKDPYNNEPHTVSLSFGVTSANINSSSAISLGTVTAKASESASAGIEGGAFNILYDIYLANQYIRNQLGKTTLNSNWWVADKVSVFWQAGFNPGSYYNTSAALSFYVPGDRELYILGGLNGNVASVDTDHFDNSIILHEYGHFLEDVYSKSQSPGGSHNGNFVIDPRLAWSEGWATFFQAAVMTYAAGYANGTPALSARHVREYVDTLGYGTSGSLYNRHDLLDGGRDSGTVDRSMAALEGHFREMSISRTLYKMSRTPASSWEPQTGDTPNVGANISFENFWDVLAEFKAGSINAANMGEFNQRLLAVVGGSASSAWTAIMNEEMHGTTNKKYASTPATGCTIEARSLTGAVEKSLGGAAKSDLYANNDFFLYNYTGGSETLTLQYRTTVAPTNTSGVVMNMDLILYRAFYVYQEDVDFYNGVSSSYIAKQSRTESALESECLTGYKCETVTLTGLTPGYYMINAKINGRKSNKAARLSPEIDGTVEYALKSSVGNYLCITN